MRDLEERLLLVREKCGQKEAEVYLKNLSKVLGVQSGLRATRNYSDKVDLILSEFSSAAGHSFANVLRSFDLFKPLTYKTILSDSAAYMSVKRTGTVAKLEENLIRSFTEGLWEKLSEKNKKRLKAAIIKGLRKNADSEEAQQLIKKVLKSGSPFAAILAGQAAGFSLYIAASTALSTVTGLVGITLGFGAYTAMSQSLAFALGPVGVVGAALFGAYKIGEPNYQRKILPAILLFTLVRSELEIAESKKKIKKPKVRRKSA